MGALLSRLLSLFYTKKLEAVLVGLENAGKTTLLHVLAMGYPVETCPTIGLNVKLVKKGGVSMKCWDIARIPPTISPPPDSVVVCNWYALMLRIAYVLLKNEN